MNATSVTAASAFVGCIVSVALGTTGSNADGLYRVAGHGGASKKPRWYRFYFGGADERYGLFAGSVQVGSVMRKRHGEAWRAYLILPSGQEPAVMARGRLDAGNGRFRTRGPAKHAVERVVRSMRGAA
jgi:hypothetical protein